MKNIAETAILVSLRISVWGATKTDRSLSDKVASDTNAERGAYRVVKEIIPKRFLDPIHQAARRLRAVRDRDCLPWLHDGTVILPILRHSAFMQDYLAAKGKFEAAVEDMIRNMPAIRMAAAAHVGNGFDPNDIPDDSTIRGMFSVTMHSTPIPTVNDFRVKMSEEIMDDIRSNYAAAMDEQVRENMTHVYERVIKVLDNMIEALTRHGDVKPGGKRASFFNDSTIQHVHDLASILGDLNITGDPALDQIADDISAKLAMFDASGLREDGELRKLAIEDAKSIRDQAKNSAASFFGL